MYNNDNADLLLYMSNYSPVTLQGVVYSFGCGFFGQLGIGNNRKSSVPVKVHTLPEKIAIVATRYFHSVRYICCFYNMFSCFHFNIFPF